MHICFAEAFLFWRLHDLDCLLAYLDLTHVLEICTASLDLMHAVVVCAVNATADRQITPCNLGDPDPSYQTF